MSFIVTKKARAADNTIRIQAILLRPKNAGIEWTPGSLCDALATTGLSYSSVEMEAICKDLTERGVVEDVKEIIPAPIAEPLPVEEPTALEAPEA